MKVFEVTTWYVSQHGGASMKAGRELVLVLGEGKSPKNSIERQCQWEEEGQCAFPGQGDCNCGYEETHVGEILNIPTPPHEDNWDLWEAVLPHLEDYEEEIVKAMEYFGGRIWKSIKLPTS